MSVKNYIPEPIEAAVQVAFDNEIVVTPTFTTDYEGSVASGNALTIVNAELPDVQDYAANGRRFTADEIETTTVKVLIDQEKIVPIRVDNIDRRQAAGSLDQFTANSGKALARDAERYVIAKMLAEAGSTKVTAVTDGTKAKAAVRALMSVLDSAEVPAEGRYLLVNAPGKDVLVDELSDASKSGSTEALRKGQIGELYGFKVIHTTDFDKGITAPAFLAYHEKAIAFIGQVDESRAIPAPDGHADILSSLLVYGAKVVRPTAVAAHVSGGLPAAA